MFEEGESEKLITKDGYYVSVNVKVNTARLKSDEMYHGGTRAIPHSIGKWSVFTEVLV